MDGSDSRRNLVDMLDGGRIRGQMEDGGDLDHTNNEHREIHDRIRVEDGGDVVHLQGYGGGDTKGDSLVEGVEDALGALGEDEDHGDEVHLTDDVVVLVEGAQEDVLAEQDGEELADVAEEEQA